MAIRAMQEAMIPALPAGPLPSILEQPWQMILQPDFQVLALGPVPLRVLAGLEQIARREKIDKTVITYRLTRDAVYRAQSGETVESITAYLEETTGQVIPQNIQRSLEEWVSAIRANRHPPQCQDPSKSILPSACCYYSTSLNSDRFSIPSMSGRRGSFPNELNRVQQCLLDLELLPAASQGAQADLLQQHAVARRRTEPRTASPGSLYVTGALMRFAEPNGRRWLLTPESIEKASTSGYTPSEIVATLKTLTGSALPGGRGEAHRSLGKHFGTGQTAQVRLAFRLKRSESLGELRAAEPPPTPLVTPLTRHGESCNCQRGPLGRGESPTGLVGSGCRFRTLVVIHPGSKRIPKSDTLLASKPPMCYNENAHGVVPASDGGRNESRSVSGGQAAQSSDDL